jgi:hypothetical protein
MAEDGNGSRAGLRQFEFAAIDLPINPGVMVFG